MATTRRSPSGPNVERSDMPGNNGAARQSVLVGDAFNDEQRSDDLPNS